MLHRQQSQSGPVTIFIQAVFISVIVGWFVSPPVQTLIQAAILLLGGWALAAKALQAPSQQRFNLGLLLIIGTAFVLGMDQGENRLLSLVVVAVLAGISSRSAT